LVDHGAKSIANLAADAATVLCGDVLKPRELLVVEPDSDDV